jgi:hypothetical protein
MIEPGSLMIGSKWVVHWTSDTYCSMNTVRLQALHRAPPQRPLCWLWSWKEDLQRTWNLDRRAVWNQVGLSHCRHYSLVTVRDDVRLRRGHYDQSRRGHQFSETTLTGESRFHISTPLGDWTRVPHDGKQMGRPLDQWNLCECSEIAGSPQIPSSLHALHFLSGWLLWNLSRVLIRLGLGI